MPTLLLQDQLQSLATELAAACPERKTSCEKLMQAAAELGAARRRRLTDEQLAALATEFDQAVGPEWSGKIPQAGALLACAVADQLEGYEGAVESLESWMTDPTRFPAHWIAAVQAALRKAHGEANQASA